MATTAYLNNPFAGSRSFNESEQSTFYGRTKQVDDVLFLLHKHKFIAITGQIGSGKSSFLQSGLIPALKTGHNGLAGKEWVICNTRPGLAPIRNLAYALSENQLLTPSVKSTPEQHSWVEKKLREGISGLDSLYRQSEIFGKKNLMIVIDQFEDLFLLTDRKNNAAVLNEETNQYINAITGANFSDEIAVYVIIALGAENIIDISPYRRLQDLLNQGQYLLPRMGSADLKGIILNPLNGKKVSLSNECIDGILSQFGSDMRMLPNLQFLFYKAWMVMAEKEGDNKMIQTEDLERLGNLTYCFANHLEFHYNSLDERGKLIFEKLFKALLSTTSLGKMTQPQSMNHLTSICETSLEELSHYLKAISQNEEMFIEILPPDISMKSGKLNPVYHKDSLVFLKNENIFMLWDRFRHWLEHEKESRDIYKRLVADQIRYEAGKTSLLRPPDLDFIWQWYQQDNPSKIWGEYLVPGYQQAIDFLVLSYNTHRNEMVFKENARKNEIRRYRRNMLIGIILGLIILIIVSSLYLNALREREIAERAKANLDKEKKRIEKLNASLQQTKDSLDGSLAEREKYVKELLNKEKTINIQNLDLIRKGSELEKSASTIKSQNQSLIVKIKETEEAKSKAEIAKEEEKKATTRATDREKLSNIKNDLFALQGEMVATENPKGLITKLNNTVNDYQELSNRIYNKVLPNNYLTQLLNITRDRMDGLNRKNTFQLVKSNAGIRAVQTKEADFFGAGDEGKLFKNGSQSVSLAGQRIRTLLPLKSGSGVLTGTFEGVVYAVVPGKEPVKIIQSATLTPAVSLLHDFKNGQYLLATQLELTLFSIEKGIITKALLRETLLAIYPLKDQNEYLLSTRNGLYLWKTTGEIKQIIPVGKGEFTHPVTAIEIAGDKILLGFKNGKIVGYPLKAFLQHPEMNPVEKFLYHAAEITKIIHFKGKLFSSSLDKSVYLVDLNLENPSNYVLKLIENKSWIWDIAIQQNKNGVDFLLIADESGIIKKQFISSDDQLNWINEMAKGN